MYQGQREAFESSASRKEIREEWSCSCHGYGASRCGLHYCVINSLHEDSTWKAVGKIASIYQRLPSRAKPGFGISFTVDESNQCANGISVQNIYFDRPIDGSVRTASLAELAASETA